LFSLIGLVLAGQPAWSQQDAASSEAERQVRAAVTSYVEAFNRADAAAVAGHWSPDAVYTNRMTGQQVVGREAIQGQFTTLFKETKNAKLEVSSESIQFVSPNVAVEHGTARLLLPNEEPEDVQYSAVYVRRDGKWLLDRVTDDDVPVGPAHYERLKELDWMVGRWVDEDEDAQVVTECSWTRNNNFLTRSFTVRISDRIEVAGMQIIGWDPAANQIRSWVFDSDGGFGHGTWTKKDDRWYVQKSGVLPDGRKTSSVNIITPVDENTCKLQSVNRSVGDELLPNIAEVTIVKQ
jgi:uncharacterized protein (TIGR02246 family)